MVLELSAVALMALLVAKEIVEATGRSRMQFAAKLLYALIVPLLAVFIYEAAFRVASISNWTWLIGTG